MSKEVGEMVRSRDVVQAEGSARTEGARRATGVPADGAAAGAGWHRLRLLRQILDELVPRKVRLIGRPLMRPLDCRN